MAQLTYYVVWRGRHTGIFDNWEDCKKQIYQFPRASFKGFRRKEMAEIAWEKGEDFAFGIANKKLSADLFPSAIAFPCICVDAACNTFTGEVEFRGVLLPDLQEIFSYGPYEKGSVNLGEFMAIISALQYCHDRSLHYPIYSDSRNALLWVQSKSVNIDVAREIAKEPLFAIIDDAVEWLTKVTYINPLLKWETAQWGENPADYGRK